MMITATLTTDGGDGDGGDGDGDGDGDGGEGGGGGGEGGGGSGDGGGGEGGGKGEDKTQPPHSAGCSLATRAQAAGSLNRPPSPDWSQPILAPHEWSPAICEEMQAISPHRAAGVDGGGCGDVGHGK